MEHTAAWRTKVIISFAAVYIIWGSTYLAIRVGVQELPPALFAGVRFVIAGILLALYARHRGQNFPTHFYEWRTIAITAFFMLVAANGLVVWGEQWVPSNQAALLVATTALWLAALGTLGAQGQALGRYTVAGLAAGFFGVALLLFPNGEKFSFSHLGGQFVILLAALLWSLGSSCSPSTRWWPPATGSGSCSSSSCG